MKINYSSSVECTVHTRNMIQLIVRKYFRFSLNLRNSLQYSHLKIHCFVNLPFLNAIREGEYFFDYPIIATLVSSHLPLFFYLSSGSYDEKNRRNETRNFKREETLLKQKEKRYIN